MAPIPRKLKSGQVIYWVALRWQGKNLWRRIGPSFEEAEGKEGLWKGQIADGTFDPNDSSPGMTVNKFASEWLATRKNRTADKERGMYRNHVEGREFGAMPIGDVRVKHTDELLGQLRDSGLSDKSIANVMGMLRPMFTAAIRREVCFTNPIVLAKNALNRRRAKEPDIYQPSEALTLMQNRNLDPRLRVLFAILFFTGMRQGEAQGRRFRDIQEAAILKCIFVNSQYDGAPTKTGRERRVPLHPSLESILSQWAETGFPAVYGRAPQHDDFLVPGNDLGVLTKEAAYKRIMRATKKHNLPFRGIHATRHTFITMARRGGANKADLERITHNSRGDIVDGYTQSDWAPLCAVMSCVRFDSDQKVSLPATNRGISALLPRG